MIRTNDVIDAQRDALRHLVRLLGDDPADPTVAARVRASLWQVEQRTRLPILDVTDDVGERFVNLLEHLLPDGCGIASSLVDASVTAAEIGWNGDRRALAIILIDMIPMLGAE